MQNKPSTYNGNVQNKNQSKNIGKIEIWEQEPKEGKNSPIYKGYVRINSADVAPDDKGYIYLQISLWKTQPAPTPEKKEP